jgi:ketosteroid isomerase-like protein
MTARDALQPLLDAYAVAYRAGDAEGCAACFTDDAQLLSPYAPPARGRTEIAALHADWVTEGDEKTLTLQDGGIEGELGWGLAAFTEGGGAEAGLTLCVFARQPGGGPWRIRLCSLTVADGAD